MIPADTNRGVIELNVHGLALMQLATQAPETFQGSADHAVSLAFYFVDPQGNGLELYVDRPESEWEWVDGEVTMGSAPLDPNAVTARSEGAMFYSAGGYHHHLATNVWQSPGAQERSNPIGLGALTVWVSSIEALDAVAERLEDAGHSYERGEATLTTQDPWANVVNVIVN